MHKLYVMRAHAGRELWLIHFLPQYTHDKDEWTDDYDSTSEGEGEGEGERGGPLATITGHVTETEDRGA